MGQEELTARRERREWLLRVSSQSLQRQRAGIAAAAVVPARVDGAWSAVPGWAGQNSPLARAAEHEEFEAIAQAQVF